MVGILILVVGLLWPVLIKLPFGKLPGNKIIDKPNIKIYIPITTMLLISIFLSIKYWLFNK